MPIGVIGIAKNDRCRDPFARKNVELVELGL